MEDKLLHVAARHLRETKSPDETITSGSEIEAVARVEDKRISQSTTGASLRRWSSKQAALE